MLFSISKLDPYTSEFVEGVTPETDSTINSCNDLIFALAQSIICQSVKMLQDTYTQNDPGRM